MILKYRYLSSLVLGAAVLLWHSNLHAQSLNYGLSISPLPAQVGKSFTVTIPIPATVPDGTAFYYLAEPMVYSGINLKASGVSANHQLAIQAPPFTTPGFYSVTVGQTQGTTGVGVSTPLALNAATVNLLVSPAGKSPNPLATLNGDYSFLFKGQTVAAPGAVSGLGAAGTFTADGNGKITSGTLDMNTAIGLELQNAALTGTYQLDATGKGSLKLITPQGPLGFNFFVPPATPGVVIRNAALVPASGFTGTGELSQVGSLFDEGVVFYGPDPYTPVPLNASVGFYEENASGGGFLPGAGSLAFNQDLTVAGTSEAIPGSPDIFTGVTGTYSSFETKRFTLTLSAPKLASTTPTHYVVYGNYFLSLDPHPATSLVVGKIQK